MTTVGPVTATRRITRLYAAHLSAEVQGASAYRASLVLGVLNWVAPLAFLALWRGAAGEGAVGGITGAQFATYFCLLLVTTNLQIPFPVIFGFGGLVYSGQLSALLLRPAHPLHGIVARALAGQVFRLPPLLVLIPIALWLTGGRVVGGPGDWALAAVVTLLGTISYVYLAGMAACIAFWMTKAQGVQGLLVGAEWILGGTVAPIALLPGPLPELLRHQPLWFADAAGPQILSGIGTHSWWIAVEAAAWVLALHAAYRVVWRRAVLRYEAVGT